MNFFFVKLSFKWVEAEINQKLCYKCPFTYVQYFYQLKFIRELAAAT